MALCDTDRASKPVDVSGLPHADAAEKPSIAELKNGKVIFKQKPISFEKHSETLQEIVKFREMLEERSADGVEVLTAIPEEYKPVIAKLVHESDKTLSALSKHILQELLPVQDEDDEQQKSMPPPLSLSAVENGIKSVANRNNYGLHGMNGVKAPASVCVWRWEVKPAHFDWLPKNAREKAENRIAERAQAKLDLKAELDRLPKQMQDSILDPKGAAGAKASAMDSSSTPLSNTIDLTGDDLKSPSSSVKKKKENEESDLTSAPKVGRPKKIPDPEKVAKDKEKQEKKAAKADREQKEREKSRTLMQNFFKPGTSSRSVPPKDSTSVAAPSSDVSQFHRTFKPFILKKDTTLAPVNWFTKTSKSGPRAPLMYDGDIIVVDDEDGSERRAKIEATNLTNMSVQERLQSALQSLPSPFRPQTTRLRSLRETRSRSSAAHLKTNNPVSIRDLMCELNEAEVAGDVNLVRAVTSKLSDRELISAKVFVFADDARPGYFGTWTRDSRMIGPRTPFTRDVAVFDYDYDSGEEWEDEPSGDADDVVEDAEDEDGDLDEADSDADSWLVDEDEEPETLSSRGASPVFPTLQHGAAKRKSEVEDVKLTKKRKVVVPLIPFAKGPCWEHTIGECEHNLLNPYRIQLFNDTPFPIDPFTFVSPSVDIKPGSMKDGFAVPFLPERLNGQPTSSMAPSATVANRTASAPKTIFPEEHIAHLLNTITSSASASFPVLINTIYQDLRQANVKKNAIEVKVREVAEKCKVKKVWVVKENFKALVQANVH